MRSIPFCLAIVVAVTIGSVSAAGAQPGNQVGVTVTGLRSSDGVVRCGLYASADGFRQPGREMRGAVGAIRGQSGTCTFSNIPPGTYAVAVFHAEHNEARIETGAFGKPKQGYGFSGNPSSGFGPPSFSAGLPVHRRSPDAPGKPAVLIDAALRITPSSPIGAFASTAQADDVERRLARRAPGRR